jgi:acyl-CoA thioesterase I
MGKLTMRLGAHALLVCFALVDVGAGVSPAQNAADTAAGTTKRIVFLGDSLTAGYGVGKDRAYPALIAERIRKAHLPYEVINAGVSGDTSADGLRRTDWVLQQKVDVLVIALGANDGLRGLSPNVLEENLGAIIEKAKRRNAEVRIVIAGMQMPPNLGADFAAKFQLVFAAVAQRYKATLIPFLLAGVGGHRDLNQPDSIHPTEAGQKVIAQTVWQMLKPILEQK